MVVPKCTQTRVVGYITDKGAPYTVFSCFYEKVVECTLSVYVVYPTTLSLFVYFLALPSHLLLQSFSVLVVCYSIKSAAFSLLL